MCAVAPTSERATPEELIRLRAVADYQFGRGAGIALFPDGINVVRSRKTGKIKGIFLDKELLATLKPSDGYLALSTTGGSRLLGSFKPLRHRVVVMDEVAEFIKNGRNLFAKHVVEVDLGIRPGEEVIITDKKGNLLAVGKAVLSGKEMKHFKKGLAVNVRRGTGDE
ncbi:MAG: PUA domain-containing protein [Candidatus Methanosuratincola sp.]